ncbi:protein rep, partial [Salmonella enterica subsp. enterica serovar Kentucky]|nr:protein rep [Salmonella enterica subsp. enterica serovar Kentucky]
RMKDRKEFKPVQGWIRTTEVTRGRDGSAHPHFHTLMMVPPSMFTDLVDQAWQQGLTEPDPRVDLSGKDVMRKLVILAREAGYDI